MKKINISSLEIQKQDGAWIQLRIPSFLRNQHVRFDIITTPEENNENLKDHFLNNGEYKHVKHWEQLENKRPQISKSPTLWPALGEQDDVIWQTWIPLSEQVESLTLHIWYPQPLLSSLKNDRGYRFELKLTDAANSPEEVVRVPMTNFVEKRDQTPEKIFVIP